MKKIIQFVSLEILGGMFVFYYIFLPGKIRSLISPAAEKTALWVKSIFFLLNNIQQETYVISGKCKGADIKVIYIGKGQRLPYIMQLSSLDGPEIRKDGSFYLWNIHRKTGHLQENADMVIIETGNFFARKAQGNGFFMVPEWVDFELQVPDSIEDISKNAHKSLKSDLSKIRKYNYSYETNRDPDKLALFYHRMYVPYISRRFSDISHIQKLSFMRRILRTGTLFFLKDNDEYVAGHFLIYRDKTLWLKWTGIKDGNQEYLRRRVAGASDYFIIKYAIEKKFETLDFGLCRAFLNDGVLRYKRKWNMTLNYNGQNTMFFGFKIRNLNDGVKNFLERNPFSFYKDRKLEGFVYIPKECRTEKEILDMCGHFMTKGLARMNVLMENSHEFPKTVDAKYPHLNLVNKEFLVKND